MGLNDRQIKAIFYVVEHENITNAKYQELFKITRNTASNDLRQLSKSGLLKPSGVKGAGAFYTLS